jgi:hypothetical protein
VGGGGNEALHTDAETQLSQGTFSTHRWRARVVLCQSRKNLGRNEVKGDPPSRECPVPTALSGILPLIGGEPSAVPSRYFPALGNPVCHVR